MGSQPPETTAYYSKLGAIQQSILNDRSITKLESLGEHYEPTDVEPLSQEIWAFDPTIPIQKLRNIENGRIDIVKTIEADQQGAQEVTLHYLATQYSDQVVQIYAIFMNKIDDIDYFLLAMEYCENGSLFEYLRLDLGRSHNESFIKDIFRDIVESVNCLHTDLGIAHRDIKPENILVTSEGNIKLADFGFAKEAKFHTNDPATTSLPACKTQLGTAFYIAPEVLERRGYDYSCDVWSLGVILHILLTGQPPFRSKTRPGNILSPGLRDKIKAGEYNRSALQGKASASAIDILEKMLVVDRNQRVYIGQVLECEWLNCESSNDDSLASVDLPGTEELGADMEELLSRLRSPAIQVTSIPTRNTTEVSEFGDGGSQQLFNPGSQTVLFETPQASQNDVSGDM